MGIRRAKPEDWRGIHSLLEQLEYPGTESFLLARLTRMLEDPAEILLVYEDAGAILGTISLHFIPQVALEGDFARISYFSVDGDARGRGIGQEMEDYCSQLARDRGCELIEVHCHSRRVRAHVFYARQGYVESPKYLIKRFK